MSEETNSQHDRMLDLFEKHSEQDNVRFGSIEDKIDIIKDNHLAHMQKEAFDCFSKAHRSLRKLTSPLLQCHFLLRTEKGFRSIGQTSAAKSLGHVIGQSINYLNFFHDISLLPELLCHLFHRKEAQEKIIKTLQEIWRNFGENATQISALIAMGSCPLKKS